MTSILAFKKEGKTYAACDSQISCGLQKQNVTNKKFLKINNEYYVFCSGIFRILSLIEMNIGQFNFTLESFNDVLTFTEKVRLLCEKHGEKIDQEKDGFSLILVTSTSIYKIATDFSSMEIEEVCSEGNGGDVCLGFYEAVKDSMEPKEVLKKAIETAAKHCNYCDDRVVYAEFE